MLAVSCEDIEKIQYPVLGTPKIDGIRCLKINGKAVTEEFTGWKGGEFEMDESTPVWVANPGDSGNTGIIDVIDDGWRVIIMTSYCNY